MFELREYQGEIRCKTLGHSPRIFHEALEDGGKYYHVHDPAGTDYDISYILTDKFREDLEEYYQNVIGNKKALGVLIRGTDYMVSNLGPNRKMATVEQILPTLREWMARDGYDVIFLATEDQRALEQMRKAFGGKLIAVAQERHSIEEFTDVKVISDLEKKLYSDKEYDERVMDTTINYFYAMYLLSRCDSFIASGQCNGVDMVLSLNENRFKNYYRFEVGMKNK